MNAGRRKWTNLQVKMKPCLPTALHQLLPVLLKAISSFWSCLLWIIMIWKKTHDPKGWQSLKSLMVRHLIQSEPASKSFFLITTVRALFSYSSLSFSRSIHIRWQRKNNFMPCMSQKSNLKCTVSMRSFIPAWCSYWEVQNEIHKTWKFRSERFPYLYGLYGLWWFDERSAFVDNRRGAFTRDHKTWAWTNIN